MGKEVRVVLVVAFAVVLCVLSIFGLTMVADRANDGDTRMFACVVVSVSVLTLIALLGVAVLKKK